MRRVVSAILGINTIVISGRKYDLVRYDKNLQFVHIQLTEEINYNDYNMVVKYRMPNGNVLADILEMETNEFDIQIPNEVVQLSGELAIEFTLSGKENDDSLTSLGRIKLTIQDTLESNIDQEEIRVLPTVANVLSRITEYTKDGITEIEKSKDEAVEELKKHSDSNVEESKEQVNIFTSQKQEQLDTYTKTKESQLDEYTLLKQGDMDSYTSTKKNNLDTYEEAKERELDSYITTVNKPELDRYTNIKKEELNSHTQTKESEITQATETKKQEITAHGASELGKFGQGAKQEADKQIGRVVAEGDAQVQRVKDESEGVIPRIEELESGKVSKSGDTMTGPLEFNNSIFSKQHQFVGFRSADDDLNKRFHEYQMGWSYTGTRQYTEIANGFPMVDNTNGILSFNTHNGSHGHQIGLSGDGKLYHRSISYGKISNWNKIYTEGDFNINSKADLTGSTFTGLVAVKKDTNGEAMVALNSAYGNGDIYSGGSAKGVGFKNRTSGKGLFLGDDGSVKLEASNLSTSNKEVITSINELKSEIDKLKQQIAEMQNK